MPKRKNKKKHKSAQYKKSKAKYYPVVYCVSEEKVICVGTIPLKIAYKNGICKVKEKVNNTQWDNAKVREGYEIEWDMYENGDVVLCPRCGSKLDFRAFPSASVPELR